MYNQKEIYWKPLISTTDFILTPAYFLFILFFFIFIRNLLYPKDKEMRKYFNQGLVLKMIGALGVGFVYFFYYGGGDTNEYFNNATVMYGAFSENMKDFFILLFNGNDYNLPTQEEYMPWMFFLRDDSSYLVGKIAGIFSLITFDTYLPIALCFAAVSFTGVWAMFVTFSDAFPKLRSQFAVATLYIPSVFFWGSGVLKDSITLGCIGWITWSSYNIFIKQRKFISSGILFIGSVTLCYNVKSYIVLSFLPSLLFWIFLTYRDRVKLRFIKVMMGPMIILFSSIAGYLLVSKIGSEFSVQAALQTASGFQSYHGYLAQTANASGYSLGAMDGSTASILKNIPAAINVTLFRPYVWETRNPVMLLSALESLAMLMFTIRIFYRTGIGRTLKAIVGNATVFFCIFFSMFFGFCVGFTAYNFGALVRYKIPCIPFFVAGLFILNYITEEENKKRIAAKTRF